MKRQTLLKSALCLLMAMVCNAMWAQTSTDGPIVTFTNVQQDGTTYTLYINNDNVLATSAESAETLGEAAKFRATLQSDGTYTFYNESKNLYMIWRGKGEGYNSDKGVSENYSEEHCKWTLASGSDSKAGTYYFYAKRSNTSKYGTLVVMKSNGAFDGWNESAAWHANYSNLYNINSEEYAVMLTDGNKNIYEFSGTGLPLYTNATLSNPTWKNGDFFADVSFSATFPVSSEANPQSVVISAFRGSVVAGAIKYYVDGENVKAKPSATVTEGYDEWEIYPTLANDKFTFIIKNVGTGKYIKTNATSASHDAGTVTANAEKAEATSFTWVEGNRFRLPTDTELYLSAGSSTTNNQNVGVYGYTGNNGTHYGVSNFVYKSVLPCVLTDADGNEYQDVIDATQGNFSSWLPSFPGCTTSEKQLAEDGTKLTASITFPFPVSSAEVTKATMIANGASWSSPNSRKWRVVTESGVDYVKVQTAEVNIADASQWLWAIYPELKNGAFTFKIKNIATGKYVYANPEATGVTNDVTGANKPVTLSAEGTAFTYKLRTGDKYQLAYNNASATQLVLSISSANNTNVYLGVYSGDHVGNEICFPDPMENTTFPFPVSSEEVTNKTLISSFNASGYTSDNFKWHANGIDIIVEKEVEPALQDLNQYYWAIYPTIDERGFTFVIKNIGTGKYIYSISNGDKHDKGTVTLAEKGTDLTFETNNCFKLPTNKYLSIGSSSASNQYVGTWDSHKGCYLKFSDLSTYTVTLPASGYSAIYTPFAVTIPDGVAAYAGTVEGNWVIPREISGTVIPANAAVILKGAASTIYTFNKTEDAADAIGNNDLKGATEFVSLVDEQGYVMQTDVEVFKLQKENIAPYTAYITRPQGSAEVIGLFNEGSVLANHGGFVNGGVYTFVTARGQMGATEEGANAISTARTTVADTNTDYFKWIVYKSINGYYLYNLGKQKFMGVQSNNNAEIAFVATPAGRTLTFKKSNSATYPIMFSTDNKGVVNHSKDRGAGLINWADGWNNLNDEGSNHQVTLVGKLTEDNLATIAEVVKEYELGLVNQATEALGTAITAAQSTANNGFLGKGLGYYTSTDANYASILEAAAEFKNGITVETTAVDEIIEQTEIVNDLFTLNVPQEGKFYRIKNNAGNGYLSSGEAGRTQFKAGIENDASSIFGYIDGKLLSYKNGMYIHNDGGQLKYADNPGQGIKINFVSSLVPGKLQIHYYTTENRYLYSSGTGSTDAGRDAANTETVGYRFTVEEVTALPVAISAAGYTTLFAPVTLEIPAEVKAYVAAEVQNSAVLLEQVEGVVPAETGLIIKGNEGSYTFNIGEEATTEITDNKLKGTVAKTLITPTANTTCYVLANGASGVGLYKASLNKDANGSTVAENGVAFINNACKVYLPVTIAGEQAARALTFRFGRGGDDNEGTTEIELPTANGQQPTAVYDLQGRRVLNPTKGMYIINGKKVVIR